MKSAATSSSSLGGNKGNSAPKRRPPPALPIGPGPEGILQSLAGDFVVSYPNNEQAASTTNQQDQRQQRAKVHSAAGDYFLTSGGLGVGGCDSVLELLVGVAKDLRDKRYNAQVVAKIVALNKGLKTYGPQLELTHKEAIDRYQVFLRNACRDGSLDLVARLQLLEIIELRAMKWKPNENLTNYYQKKMSQVAGFGHKVPADYVTSAPKSPLNVNAMEFHPPSTPGVGGSGDQNPMTAGYLASATASLTSMLSVNSASQLPLAPTIQQGQMMVNAGKNMRKPPPVKNQLREEIVIRNADSGKVDAGAKERMVQVIGSDEGTIALAKTLIQETIQRNSSPEPPPPLQDAAAALASSQNGRGQQGGTVNNNWMTKSKADLATFSYTVEVGGGQSLKILGGDPEMVRAAKMALDEHFRPGGSGPPEVVPPANLNTSACSDAVCQTETVSISYDRRRLLAYSASPLCRQPPTGWTEHWEGPQGLKAELGRNFLPPGSSLPIVGDQVDQEDILAAGVAALYPQYFVPDPEKFYSANAKCPQGFVRLPIHFRQAGAETSGGVGGGMVGKLMAGPKTGGAGHLDKLFAAGQAHASQQEQDMMQLRHAPRPDAPKHAPYQQKSKKALMELLANAKVWDEDKREWVSAQPIRMA